MTERQTRGIHPSSKKLRKLDVLNGWFTVSEPVPRETTTSGSGMVGQRCLASDSATLTGLLWRLIPPSCKLPTPGISTLENNLFESQNERIEEMVKWAPRAFEHTVGQQKLLAHFDCCCQPMKVIKG